MAGLDNHSQTGPLLVATYIQKAIEEKKRGAPTNFNFIVSQLTDPRDSLTAARWLQGLKGCASTLTKDSHQLVDAALRVDWRIGDQVLFASFVDFVENLVSSNAYFVQSCLQFLISHMEYRDSQLLEVNMESFDRFHFLLGTIFRMVPRSSSVACPMIAENFPHKRVSIEGHRWYVKNLLRITEYAPELFTEFFPVVIDRLIKIDLEIQVEKTTIDLESLKEDETMFAFDDDEHQPEVQAQEEVNELLQKLDTMMTVVFESLQSFFEMATPEAIDIMMQFLLGVFENLIMKTHQSRYVQFLFFFAFSKKEHFSDVFLSFLFQILVDPTKNPIVRESAAAYIAGFLARANYVNVSTVVRLLDLLVPWLHSFIDHCERSIDELEPHKYSLFYYACQALFYIICFRHKDLLALEGGSSGYFAKMRLERIIQCKFNPLKICSPEIVGEFARITNTYQLAYCFNVIERNKKIVPAGKALLATEALSKELRNFYVFEPFDLPMAQTYVKNLYQEYQAAEEFDEEDISPKDKGSRRPSREGFKLTVTGASADDDSSDFFGGMAIAESVEDRSLADRFATSVDPFD